MRAFAAIAVVASHSANSLLGHQGHLLNLDPGAYGVDVFFVVSGFIMFYTTFGTSIGPGTFLAKRLIRIVPLYWLLSTLLFILVTLKPAAFNKTSPDVWSYIQSILFIPHWNPRSHDLQPIVGQGWTLNNEMFFYVLFALSLCLRSSIKILLVLAAIGGLVLLGRLVPISNPVYLTYTSPLMLEFCFGIILGVAASVAPPNWSLRLLVGLMVVLAVLTVYFDVFYVNNVITDATRPIFVGLPSALLVLTLVIIEFAGWLPSLSWLALIGDCSYSLYLIHDFVLGFGQRLWHRFVGIDSLKSHTVFVFLILSISIVLAIFVYRYVELPVARKLMRGARLRRAGSAENPGKSAAVSGE